MPQECTLQKEDYLECLHHYKEVRAACCVAPRLDWLASTARGSIPSADALFCPFLRPTTYDPNPLETRPPLDMNIVLRRLRPHPTPPAPRRTRIALAPRAGLASTDDQGAIPIQDGARAQGEADRSRGAGRVGDHVARPIKGGRQEGVAPELAEPGMERVGWTLSSCGARETRFNSSGPARVHAVRCAFAVRAACCLRRLRTSVRSKGLEMNRPVSTAGPDGWKGHRKPSQMIGRRRRTSDVRPCGVVFLSSCARKVGSNEILVGRWWFVLVQLKQHRYSLLQTDGESRTLHRGPRSSFE